MELSNLTDEAIIDELFELNRAGDTMSESEKLRFTFLSTELKSRVSIES